jgi:hypothetical protein
MIKSHFIAAIVTMCTLLAVAAQDSRRGVSPPPGSLTGGKVAIFEGLECQISIRPNFLVVDTIAFDLDIESHSDETLELKVDDGAGRPEVVLIDSAGRERKKNISLLKDSRTVKYARWMKPYGVGLSARIDLTELFGKFEPGSYQFSLRLPSNSLTVASSSASFADGVQFPLISFQVDDVSLETIESKLDYKDVLPITFVDRVLGHGRRVRRATAMNTLKTPVVVYYDEVWGKSLYNGRYSLILSDVVPTRWAIHQSYQSAVRQPIDPAFRKAKMIEPGESIEIALPEWECVEKGVYYFEVLYYVPHKTDPHRLVLGGAMMSKPFVVDLTAHR